MGHHEILLTVALTISMGVLCQAMARRLQVPAIVPLLALGVALGPGALGVLNPDALGSGLRVVVGLAVAVILFEGGLSLKREAFRLQGGTIRRLVILGSLLTWTLSTLLARVLMPELGLGLAAIFGALVIVTGPTVIAPLLQTVRPRRRLGDILRGEAILADPIGALLAVLTLEVVLLGHDAGEGEPFVKLLYRFALGGGLGAAGAWGLHLVLKREDYLPAELRNLGVLAAAIGLYAVSETVLHESGVLTVTVAGFLLASLHPPGIGEIEEFKGHLTVLMVSMVFLLLSADLELRKMWDLGLAGVGIVAGVMFVVRPIVIWACTVGSRLSRREKLFLAWIAPRGIVAASVSSLFAVELLDHGFHYGERVRDLTFATIAGTVLLQGPTARLVGRWLQVLERERDGFLILGAGTVGKALAKALQGVGSRALLIDTNPWRVRKAQESGLEARVANVFDELRLAELDFASIGGLLAVTPNDSLNRAAARRFQGDYGSKAVRAIRLHDSPREENAQRPPWLFGERLGGERMESRLLAGWTVEMLDAEDAVALAEVAAALDPAIPLFARLGKKTVFLGDADEVPAKSTLFLLAPPEGLAGSKEAISSVHLTPRPRSGGEERPPPLMRS